MTVKVSVVVATYCPGEAVQRVVDSLDAQTLPQAEFETIFVDDGSTDDTLERLRAVAATRPTVQVVPIANSGWPSRPRNVGIDRARGEYVLFMDHDDSLYPDALRRGYEYARETDADVVSPKESRTSEVWWSLTALLDGNIADIHRDAAGIDRLAELVPHKLYRRQFLLEHGIRFREGARVLWEDQLINIEAYRHARTISVLADTPFYLWHASDTNSTHTFDPLREDFWDRLEDLLVFIRQTLDTPRFADAQLTMLATQVRGRILDRLVRLLAVDPARDTRTVRMAAARARRLLLTYTTDDVFAALASKKHQAQAYLLRANRVELLREFHAFDLAAAAQVRVTSARWQQRRLHLELESRWAPTTRQPLLRRSRAGVRLAVSRELERRIPSELLTVQPGADDQLVELAVRSRTGHVTWPLTPAVGGTRVEEHDGALTVLSVGTCELDLGTAAVGAALAPAVWDLRCRVSWMGRMRKAGVQYAGPVRPALLDGRAAVAYANASKALSLDLAQAMRTLAIDAAPRSGPAGAVDDFRAPLQDVAVFGVSELDAGMLVALPADIADATDAAGRDEVLERLAADGGLAARIVSDDVGAWLVGSAALPPGAYRIYARRGGTLHPTRRTMSVDDERQVSLG